MFCITDQSNRGRFNSWQETSKETQMGIKRNIEITAEVLNTKASRLQAIDRAEQAERLLRMDEARPATTKVKKGVQALTGRTRVDRAREEVEIETLRSTREIYAEMMSVIRGMEEFAAANPPAWIRWSFDRHGRGLTVMASPFDNSPCPICATYPISEQGLAQLEEDSGWMA
jgi:hypothetical protein